MKRLSRIEISAPISTVTSVVQGVMNLALLIYLARVLAPVAYGSFSYTWAVVAMVSTLTSLGIPSLLTRDLSRVTNGSSIITQGISLLSQISVIVSLGFFAVVQIIPGLHAYRPLFDLWTLFLLFNSINPRWILASLGQLWVATLGDLWGVLFRLVLTIWLVRRPSDIPMAIAVTGLSLVIPLIAQYVWIYRETPYRMTWIPFGRGWHQVRRALPLGIMGFVSILYSGMDTWILHLAWGSRAVGIYTAAYRPVVFLATLSSIYFNLIFPILSRTAIKQVDSTRHLVRLFTVAVVGVVVPIGIGSDLLATPLMEQAFGLHYASSGVVLSILIWSWCFTLIRDTFSTTLVAANQEARFAKLFVSTGLINLGLMTLLVHWGPIGTASALVVTQALLLVLSFRVVRRIVAVDWQGYRQPLIKILLNSVVMGISVWFLRRHLPLELTILAGLAIYAGSTWITKSIPWREILLVVHRAS